MTYVTILKIVTATQYCAVFQSKNVILSGETFNYSYLDTGAIEPSQIKYKSIKSSLYIQTDGVIPRPSS